MLSSWLYVFAGCIVVTYCGSNAVQYPQCCHAGYGEENLGGDDLSDLRAASDGHGPYAKYN